MPIHFHTDPQQVHVEFLGGDLIVGLCGEDEGVDAIGIAAAPRPGISGEDFPEDEEATPSVYLSFKTAASLDTFIRTLQEYREACFSDLTES